jgi:hypothetical protein
MSFPRLTAFQISVEVPLKPKGSTFLRQKMDDEIIRAFGGREARSGGG